MKTALVIVNAFLGLFGFVSSFSSPTTGAMVMGVTVSMLFLLNAGVVWEARE